MLEAIKTLLTSKRSMVGVLTVTFDLLVLLGFDLDPALAELIASLATVVGSLLIAGISHSDHGKAMGLPAGVDHKGRGAVSDEDENENENENEPDPGPPDEDASPA